MFSLFKMLLVVVNGASVSCVLSFFQEVIPYLNEHMEDNCTSELLGYIRNLVLSRIQVNEDQVQFWFSYSHLFDCLFAFVLFNDMTTICRNYYTHET